MKGLILFTFLFITATCDTFGNVEIYDTPNPNTEKYIEMFEIEMTLDVDIKDGSCDVFVWLKNSSEYPIKKMVITYEICNRIGESIRNDKSGKYRVKSSLIGPISPKESYWGIMDDVFYNYMAETVKIISVDIEYM